MRELTFLSAAAVILAMIGLPESTGVHIDTNVMSSADLELFAGKGPCYGTDWANTNCEQFIPVDGNGNPLPIDPDNPPPDCDATYNKAFQQAGGIRDVNVENKTVCTENFCKDITTQVLKSGACEKRDGNGNPLPGIGGA